MKAKRRTTRIGLPWPTWKPIPPKPQPELTDAQKMKLIMAELEAKRKLQDLIPQRPPLSESERRAGQMKYAALKRAHAAGLSLWFVRGDIKKQLDDFAPKRVFGPIYGHDLKASGSKKLGHHRLKASMKEGRDASPCWENGIRALEDGTM